MRPPQQQAMSSCSSAAKEPLAFAGVFLGSGMSHRWCITPPKHVRRQHSSQNNAAEGQYRAQGYAQRVWALPLRLLLDLSLLAYAWLGVAGVPGQGLGPDVSCFPVCGTGDADQLPPVGPGSVLSAAIAANAVPVVDLRDIFRQARQSNIVTSAHDIHCGRFPSLAPVPPRLPVRGPRCACMVAERNEAFSIYFSVAAISVVRYCGLRTHLLISHEADMAVHHIGDCQAVVADAGRGIAILPQPWFIVLAAALALIGECAPGSSTARTQPCSSR